jgi:hypothetical protein
MFSRRPFIGAKATPFKAWHQNPFSPVFGPHSALGELNKFALEGGKQLEWPPRNPIFY